MSATQKQDHGVSMAQLINIGGNTPLRAPITGVTRYEFTGETVGGATTSIFVDGRKGYTVALEPKTAGLIHCVGTLIQTSTSNTTFIEANYIDMLARYNVTKDGLITLSVGAYTVGPSNSPHTPSPSFPNNRLNGNLVITPINKSNSSDYPYIRFDTLGGGETNMWLVTADIWTLPFKGG